MRNTSATKMSLVVAIAALGLGLRAHSQDRLTLALTQFQNETDPVRKARDLSKLGDAQIELAARQLKSGEDVVCLATLKQYSDEVQQTAAALKSTGIDAERKPAGFKELQISLRETVRRIDDLILTLPVDKRPFFREIRADVLKTQNELVDALFPRRPEVNSKKPSS